MVPEHSRISVLSSGSANGSITASIAFGGNCPPIASASSLEEQREVEPRPEPADEEHHFRSDEQDHAVTQVKLHDRRVIAGLGFASLMFENQLKKVAIRPA